MEERARKHSVCNALPIATYYKLEDEKFEIMML